MKCDRCGTINSVPRGYGFADGKNGVKNVGYNLCLDCAVEWEKIIGAHRWKTYKGKWHIFANKLLIKFVTEKREKVEFT